MITAQPDVEIDAQTIEELNPPCGCGKGGMVVIQWLGHTLVIPYGWGKCRRPAVSVVRIACRGCPRRDTELVCRRCLQGYLDDEFGCSECGGVWAVLHVEPIGGRSGE